MNVLPDKVEQAVKLVKRKFPDWHGFDDPRFVEEERDYKDSAVLIFKKLLSELELKKLIDSEDYDEILNRIKKVAQNTNLLFLGVPSSGDLNILFQKGLDKQAFCNEIFHLLYSDETMNKKIWRYTDFVKKNNLPNKWTFPTYFLFLCHPDSALFVKPQSLKWFVNFILGNQPFSKVPTPPTYNMILEFGRLLKRELYKYNPKDMIDIQSFIWVCFRSYQQENKNMESYSILTEKQKVGLTERRDHYFSYLSHELDMGLRYDAVEAVQDWLNETAILEGKVVSSEELSNLIKIVGRIQKLNAMNLPELIGSFNYKKYFQDYEGTYEEFIKEKPDAYPGIDLDQFCMDLRNIVEVNNDTDFVEILNSLFANKQLGKGILSGILNLIDVKRFPIINGGSLEVLDKGNDIELTAKQFKDVKEDVCKHYSIDNSQYPDELIKMLAWMEIFKEIKDYLDLEDYQLVDRVMVPPGWPPKVPGVPKVNYYSIQVEEKEWPKWLGEDYIAIGWKELGDLSGITKEEFSARSWNVANDVVNEVDNMKDVWRFTHHFQNQDVIVAYNSPYAILGIGLVKGPYKYVENEEKPHIRPIKWLSTIPIEVDWIPHVFCIIGMDGKEFWKKLNKKEKSTKTMDDSQVPKYWLIDVEDYNSTANTVWEDCKNNGRIRFDYLDPQKVFGKIFKGQMFGDIFGDMLAEHFNNSYSQSKAGNDKYVYKPILKQGDIVIAKSGWTTLYGYGKIISDPQCDKDLPSHNYFCKVDWQKVGKWHIPDDISVLPLQSVIPLNDESTPSPDRLVEIMNDNYFNTWFIQAGDEDDWWPDCLVDGQISVGFDKMNKDLSELSTLEIKALYYQEYGNDFAESVDTIVDFVQHVKPGDCLIYKRNNRTILGWGEVICSYVFNPDDTEYMHSIDIDLVDRGVWELPEGYPNIPSERLAKINLLEYNPDELLDWLHINRKRTKFDHGEYTLETLAEETGFTLSEITCWKNAIERKGQAILYGPPGTGKTFLARKLASHFVGGGDGVTEFVQFHPAYAYEDFMQGIRPQTQKGILEYSLEPGRFLSFCQEAKKCRKTCVLIIDEINRANLARVFGELMYLMEYRNESIPLAGGNKLRIPKNVRIIGTMNTADRSIALVDHALRRRFAFIGLYPNYNVLRKFHSSNGFDPEALIKILKDVNKEIADKNYHIGISFFLQDDIKTHLKDIWLMEVEPYLEEYFFDRPEIVERFGWDKIKESL